MKISLDQNVSHDWQCRFTFYFETLNPDVIIKIRKHVYWLGNRPVEYESELYHRTWNLSAHLILKLPSVCYGKYFTIIYPSYMYKRAISLIVIEGYTYTYCLRDKQLWSNPFIKLETTWEVKFSFSLQVSINICHYLRLYQAGGKLNGGSYLTHAIFWPVFVRNSYAVEQCGLW